MPLASSGTRFPHPLPSCVRYHLCLRQLESIRDANEMDRALTSAEEEMETLHQAHIKQREILRVIGLSARILGVLLYTVVFSYATVAFTAWLT